MDLRAAESTLQFAEEASATATGPHAKDALERLETRLDEVLAARDWFLEAGRMDEALRTAIALYRFWITKQRFTDGAAAFERVLATPGGDDLLRGKAALSAGMMPFWMGEDAPASELFGEALEIGRRLGDMPLTSQALGGLARVALRTDVPEARRLAAEALAVSDAAGDEGGRSNALHLLGVGAQLAGDPLEARAGMTQRLALVRATDNQFLIASEAANLSMVERQLGELEAAEALAHEALEIESRTGDQFTTPFAISGLASIATERGEFERAAMLVGASESIMEAQGMAWPPDERPHYERLLIVLPDAMGVDVFEAARSRGRAMTLADAVIFALGPIP
jgi:tetratricopeptide (TPR) repeat protein